ncbi:MAG TPA: DNA mismatch repair protein MutS [Ferruginibacter sp.]|nr:DNA mismatch repair protein MutS [Ferruginibacter sp.]HRO17217.1 DNA mismatch repair protein MutS [Ferruginibacter sp.]HRQ20399.1 DNA mismatch repair protein MutS [Ferruginibacter sp.]
MKLYPASTLQQLEFDTVRDWLIGYCRTAYARKKAAALRIHTHRKWIEHELKQAAEFKQVLHSGFVFPNQFTEDVQPVIQLLSISGATVPEEQWMQILALSSNTEQIFRWFNAERADMYPALFEELNGITFDKKIAEKISEVLDEHGQVRDQASEELASIRMSIYRKRNELRRMFDGLSLRYNKLGYLSDIGESFLNGRRVLAVVAEYKRMVKGVLHGESDSRRTSFIEPEETTSLNNELFSLSWDERKEIQRLLKKLTAELSVYATPLANWLKLCGTYDFIQAKAKLAIEYQGTAPVIEDRAVVDLKDARHPLLLRKNASLSKPVIPLNIRLDEQSRILVISGPNAGGKTVTLKTIGLLQLMVQSGLLVPVGVDSVMGIFKQIFIHIGDTQSIEFELSTYSAQLKNMKHFTEHANGKTLFFIDELGSGSDPALGGAFAEVFLEALIQKHAMGVVTTHYLNLKIMANHVKGIVNGAMQFDEKKLLPLYKLQVGQPGSSYTFSIAERIGIDPSLIKRARALAEKEHIRLDQLLNRTEQDLQRMDKEREQLQQQIRENTRLKAEMEKWIAREQHQQEMERLKHQNAISSDRLAYLKDMERKLKAMVVEWRRAEDKTKAVQMIQALLFGQKEKFVVGKKEKHLNEKFMEVEKTLHAGDLVKLKSSRVVGTLKEIKGKKAIVQVGQMPMTVDIKNLVVVVERQNSAAV